MDKIKELRQNIDTLDEELMSLLDKRYEISKQIGSIKSDLRKDVLDQNREAEVLNKAKKYSFSSQIESVYMAIMKESKNIQRK